MDGQTATRESLWQTIRGDFAAASGLRILGVLAMLAWMAFQWGWGNDILLPPIVATGFDAVDDGESWLSALGAVGLGTGAGGLFWLLTQAVDGIVVLSGLRLLPGITERISQFLKGKGWVKPFGELSLGTRFLIAYASGASILCLIDVFATGRQGLRSRWRMLAEAVALSAGGVALAIVVITSATAVGTRIPATSDAADTVVRYAKNPLTWLVIYATIIAISALVSRLRSNDAASPAA